MRNVARESDANLQALFTNTSAKSGLSPAVIEKDFWVCWLLDYLFDRSPWKNNLLLKEAQVSRRRLALSNGFLRM
jgi:hypothetical protein